VLADWTTAPVGPKLSAALGLVQRMTLEPATIDADFLQGLADRGLTVAEVEAASTVAFRYAMINRAADVFAFPVPTPAEAERMARSLSRMNGLLRIQPPDPLFQQGPDGLWRPTDADRARTQLLTAPGSISPRLRQDVEAFAAAYFGATRPQVELEEPALSFVGRVAAFPSAVDDALVDTLRGAGYDDEAIFELTMSAAMGVACAGVEPLADLVRPR